MYHRGPLWSRLDRTGPQPPTQPRRRPPQRGLNTSTRTPRQPPASRSRADIDNTFLRLLAVCTLKGYSKALEYEYRVKTAALGTLK
jgi:hypothetical protein